jgi:hypothetical protein
VQDYSSRAYLVAAVDRLRDRFVSRAVVTAEGPDDAVRKVRTYLVNKGEPATESIEMQAIELGDLTEGAPGISSGHQQQQLLLRLGDEFEW